MENEKWFCEWFSVKSGVHTREFENKEKAREYAIKLKDGKNSRFITWIEIHP